MATASKQTAALMQFLYDRIIQNQFRLKDQCLYVRGNSSSYEPLCRIDEYVSVAPQAIVVLLTVRRRFASTSLTMCPPIYCRHASAA